MPTSLDTKLGPKVKSLIARFGAPAVLSEKTIMSQDVVTGSVNPGPPTEHDVKVTPPTVMDQVQMPNFTIKGSAVSFIAAQGIPAIPLIDWGLIISGRRYTIVDVQSLYSGELVAAYALGLET